MTTILSEKVDRTDENQEKGSFCQKGSGTVLLLWTFSAAAAVQRTAVQKTATQKSDRQRLAARSPKSDGQRLAARSPKLQYPILNLNKIAVNCTPILIQQEI